MIGAFAILVACNRSSPERDDRRATTDSDSGDVSVGPVCEDEAPSARLVRRLSRQEYANTVRDLLGVVPTVALAADASVDGYDNDAATLSVGAVLADQLRIAAEEIATEAVGYHWSQMMPCTDETRECALRFVTDVGKKAYRRPLGESEIEAHMAFYDEIAAEDGFRESIRWLLATFLVSPNFLYRTELGSRTEGEQFALSDWEIASELSYLLWGTMPDARLFTLAEAGELHTEEQIASEVARMLAHAKASPAVARFVRLWLPSENVRDAVKSAELYPDFTAEIRDAMIEEIERDVQDAYGQGLGIRDLILADSSWMSPALAAYYGVELDESTVDSEGWGKVDLSAVAGGGSVLTRGALMASLGTPTTSSPVRRGKLIRENLLCQTMPSPPSNVEIVVPEYTEGATTRALYEGYTLADEYCAGCHVLMDRIGFGFENYGGDGTYRTTEQEQPVDASGEIVRSPRSDAAFTGPDELFVLLAESADVKECHVRNWLQYATGATVDDDSTCASEIAARVDESGGGFAATLAALAARPDLRVRTGEAGELDGPAPPAGK